MLALLLLWPETSASAEKAPEIQAKSAIMITADGQCLYEKNADSRMLIASTTKLMTALVCLEQCGLDEPVSVKPAHCAVEGSSMYLKAGDRYTVRELLTGLLLASGNDAALALADAVGGSEAGFYSTAHDLAKLMCACMENADFRAITSTVSAQIRQMTYLNHNKLLTRYPGCIGGKTGYTRAAGRCLVSCCEKNDLRLICVTLSDPDDWHDQSALYDWAYAGFRWLTLSGVCRFEVPVISGSRDKLTVQPAEDARVLIPSGEEVRLQAELPRFVFAPVNSQEAAGHVDVLLQNRRIAVFPLYYTQGAAMAYPVFQTHAAEEGNPWPNEFKNSYPKRALCPAVRRSRPFLQAGCW